MSARVKLPDPLDKLLRSELETAIHEAALHRDDELIARRYIIDKWCHRRRSFKIHHPTCSRHIKPAKHKPYIRRTQPRLGTNPAGVFFCENLSMEDVGNQGQYTSLSSSRTPYFFEKDV